MPETMKLADIIKRCLLFLSMPLKGEKNEQRNSKTTYSECTFQKIRGRIQHLYPTGSKNQPKTGRADHSTGREYHLACYLSGSLLSGLENGASIDDVVKDILQIYSSTKMYPNHFDVTSIQDFDYVKGRLFVKLINKHLNQELLQDVPHSLFLDDFAVTVRCMVTIRTEENASFLVHNGHLGMWHIGQEELLALAVQNTRELLGLDLRNMGDFMKEFFPDPVMEKTADTPLWIMTNRKKLYGAATVLFDDALKDFADTHGDFYVIFSSVHEILLLPTPDSSSIDDITKMNQEVNAAQVQEDEILGTKAYYYGRNNGFVL